MTPPGWHPDPYRRHELRWWDGAVWSEHVSDQGRVGVDPVGVAPVSGTSAGWLPPTVQQPVVATNPGGPGRRSPLPWIVGGVLAVLVAGVGTVVALRSGSDDEPGAVTTDPVLITTIAPGTTAAPDTTGPLLLPTTANPPTTPPSETSAPGSTTPAEVTPTGDALAAALPTPDDLPADWAAAGSGQAIDFEGGSGLGQGLCGGDGESARAWGLASVGNAFSDYFDLPSTAQVSYWLVGFPDAESASAYLAATADQAQTCAETINYELDEGTEPGQYDGFAEGFGDTAIWTFDETAVAAPSTVAEVDESLELGVAVDYSTVFDGAEYGGSFGALRLYERYGTVVLVTELLGEWDLRGFADTDLPSYQPTADDLVAVSDIVRPIVLERLRSAGLIG